MTAATARLEIAAAGVDGLDGAGLSGVEEDVGASAGVATATATGTGTGTGTDIGVGVGEGAEVAVIGARGVGTEATGVDAAVDAEVVVVLVPEAGVADAGIVDTVSTTLIRIHAFGP